MGQVTVTLNGRTYRLSCGDGEEERLLSLASHVRERIEALSTEFGHAGDDRLLLMAALLVTDELFDARDRLMEAMVAGRPADADMDPRTVMPPEPMIEPAPALSPMAAPSFVPGPSERAAVPPAAEPARPPHGVPNRQPAPAPGSPARPVNQHPLARGEPRAAPRGPASGTRQQRPQ